MQRKYWVPALERANDVLKLISQEPNKWKFKDMCEQLNISKSTMFSLLHTMEELQWISKNGDTYSLGIHYGMMGHSYFNQFDIISMFNKEAPITMLKVQESIQLAYLDKDHVVYLAKINGPSPIQMVSGPGARIPAHATGLGKVLLSNLEEERLHELFPDKKLKKLTEYTITEKSKLLKQLKAIKKKGYVEDIQEGVMGFCCVAAPVYNAEEEMIASVSISMPVHQWEGKKDLVIEEVRDLASRLSLAE